MNLKQCLILILILIMCLQTNVYSQDEGDKLSIATYRKINSQVLNEERTIAVSLPERYENSKKRYPVLYLLDAESSGFAWYVGFARFLSQHKIPEMIIVGVLNTIRNKDLWSYEIEDLDKTSDNGASNFLKFFSKELIPFIDKNYRTTPHRTIYGESAGGHFVTFSLLENPDLFEAYLASSPVIGFSNDQLLRKAEFFFKKNRSLPKSFFIYYGDTDYNSVTERIPVLESIIRKDNPKGFNWGIRLVEGRHVPSESLYELLLMLYSDWQPVSHPVIIPSEGEFIQGGSISVQITGSDDPVHFTLNGEEPSRSSPVYKEPIIINSSCTLKAKSIRGDLQESRTVSTQFKVKKNYRASEKVDNPKNGLKYKYLEKQLFNSSDYITDSPDKSGVISSLDIGIRNKDQFYQLQFEGYIKIPSTGQYRLSLLSNSTKLFIDNELIISGSGLLPGEKSREICLESGYHSMRIISNILTEPEHIVELYWEGTGIKKEKIPEKAFFYMK